MKDNHEYVTKKYSGMQKSRGPPPTHQKFLCCPSEGEEKYSSMSIKMNIKAHEPLEDGSYQAVLKSIEMMETVYGERLMWLFSIPEHSAEVAGFTSLSESTQANAYNWAVTLNADIASKKSWGSSDVVGKWCTLVVELYEGEKGKKNKVVRVKPPKDGEPT